MPEGDTEVEFETRGEDDAAPEREAVAFTERVGGTVGAPDVKAEPELHMDGVVDTELDRVVSPEAVPCIETDGDTVSDRETVLDPLRDGEPD